MVSSDSSAAARPRFSMAWSLVSGEGQSHVTPIKHKTKTPSLQAVFCQIAVSICFIHFPIPSVVQWGIFSFSSWKLPTRKREKVFLIKNQRGAWELDFASPRSESKTLAMWLCHTAHLAVKNARKNIRGSVHTCAEIAPAEVLTSLVPFAAYAKNSCDNSKYHKLHKLNRFTYNNSYHLHRLFVSCTPGNSGKPSPAYPGSHSCRDQTFGRDSPLLFPPSPTKTSPRSPKLRKIILRVVLFKWSNPMISWKRSNIQNRIPMIITSLCQIA